MKAISILAVVLLFSFSINSCDEPPEPPVPEELITTVELLLTPAGIGPAVTMTFLDTDGDGGNSPVISGGTLMPFTDYQCDITLANESVTPAEDITMEVEETAEEHQFFFIPAGVDLSINYNDLDSDDKPVGLSSVWSAGDVSSGTLTVILRHKPDKDAPDVSEGDITNAGGESDVEISFDVDIQ